MADLPDIVSKDEAYQNAIKNSDEQNARAESDRATTQAILATMSSGIELYKAIQANDSFRKWVLDMVFNATYTSFSGKGKSIVNSYETEELQESLKVAEEKNDYEKVGV